MGIIKTWKIWLRPNVLTAGVINDYFAVVSTVGRTLRNEDIVDLIVKGRSEMRPETILSILNERDGIVIDTLQGGSSVQDGCVHMSPRVPGPWIGGASGHDPKIHVPTINAIPTAALRKALAEVGLEVLGVKDDGGAVIGLVTDVATGKTDGTVTSGGMIIIAGEKIKIEPALGDKTVFVLIANDQFNIPIYTPFAHNGPKELILALPALDPGIYTLSVTTRYASGSNLLKEPRTIVYNTPLTVL